MKKSLILAALITNLFNAHGENWPFFRGPSRQGISTETGLPTAWSSSSNVVWKAGIPGESWSSPIVWGNRVFLITATDNGQSCRVLSVDAKSGKIIWDKEVFTQVPLRKEGRNTYATPTPATDGETVFAVFGDGSFAALDFAGEIKWINRDYKFYSQHGLGSSPILHEDLVIMSRDGSNEGEDKKIGWQVPWDKSYVVALDKKTGKEKWKTGRGLSRIAHIAPTIWQAADGHTEVVSGAGDVVQGFDFKTGKLLWTSENKGEGVVPSVVLGDGVVFTCSGWSGRESLKAFKLGAGTGDLKESNLVWEQRKGMPRVPSPLWIKPYLFTIKDDGVAMCLKEDTGEILWQERVGGNHSASPVSAEGKIYLISDEGETTIIEAKPEFKVVGKNQLGEKIQASIAVSNKRLFIRTEKNLYCIGQ